MKCKIAKGTVADYKGDALIIFVYQDLSCSEPIVRNIIKDTAKKGHFKGSEGELFQIYPCQDLAGRRVLLVGLGEKANISQEKLRKAAAKAVKNLRS